jgi:CubicO group peptidase (beta-lactamase class C family)/Flp pilus assembly protein TadD
MRPLTLVVAVALLVCQPFARPALVAGQAPQRVTTDQLAERLRAYDEFVNTQMASDRTVGITIGVVKDGAVWVKGYGFADLENRVPTKPETAYRLGSVSKPITAIAVMQLVERGKIDLDAELQTYVPYFPRKPWPVTVRQLLGHLGGISHYKNPEAELHIKVKKSTREAVAIFENFDLVAEPGTRSSYSSYGYNLLGAVIEGASGRPFGEYLRENVWGPFGMSDTRMDDPLEIIPNRARGYQLIDGKVANSEFVDISSRFGAGGTRSTVPDMLKFASGVMEGKLLGPASWDAMFTPMATRDGQLTGYGFGWEASPLGGRFAIAHSGGQQETRTLLYIFPKRNLAIAAAMNFENASPGPYLARLFEVLTGEQWETGVYAGDRFARAQFAGVWDAFDWGLAHLERHQAALASDEAAAAEAFAFFNRTVSRSALEANLIEGRKAVASGRHPASGQALVKVGSYMALKLRAKLGAERVAAYPSLGPFVFFNDYIELYRSDSSIPKALRFEPALEAEIARWNASWARTATPEIRDITITASNVDEVGQRLRTAFAGANAYPDFYGQLFDVTRGSIMGGNVKAAVSASRLAADLYPEMGAANGLYGIILVVSGRTAEARSLLRKSLEIDPGGLASARDLNFYAFQLANAGAVDAGLELLKIAVEMHPKAANLYDSIGEFHLKKGQKESALEYYRKALEIDPKLATAQEAVKRLTAN